MFDKFSDYIGDKIALTAEELQRIKAAAKEVKLKKGEHLLDEGKIWKFRAYVNSGLLRTFRIDDDGQEYSIRFAIENWWTGDGESYLTGLPSVYYIDALERSEVILWEKTAFDALIREIPALHELSELLMSRNLIASQNRIYLSNSLTAEEKYENFLKTYPEFAKRIPLHMIASYLGVTRETLSRARRKAVKR